MNPSTAHDSPMTQELNDWLAQQRPALFRYCTRMTGSVYDGEDAVQDAMLNAVRSFPGFNVLAEPKAWLFRVAYNASMAVLRARARLPETAGDEQAETVVDAGASAESRWVTTSALRHFMWLTPSERSCVIFMDVLGYTLQEIAQITGRTVVSIKASLHRGRARLKEVVESAEPVHVATLGADERALLDLYIQRFNARDFDGVRAMLGDEVRLDLVGRVSLKGKAQVGTYVHRYADKDDWVLAPGMVDGRPAALVYSPSTPNHPPSYFVLLEFAGGRVQGIRDFRYARYASESLELVQMEVVPGWSAAGGSHAKH